MLDGKTALTASSDIVITSSADIFTDTLLANVSISVTANAIRSAKGELAGTAGIVVSGAVDNASRTGIALPTRAGFGFYLDKPGAAYLTSPNVARQQVLIGSSSLSLTASADITTATEGQIQAIGSIVIDQNPISLGATGELLAAIDVVVITTQATLTNAAASPIVGASSIVITDANTINGKGELATTGTIVIDSDARLTSGAIQGTSTISVTGSNADANLKRVGGGTSSIVFTSDADARRLGGEAISATGTIVINASLAPKTTARGTITIVASGTLQQPIWTEQADDESIWTEQPDDSTVWTEVA